MIKLIYFSPSGNDQRPKHPTKAEGFRASTVVSFIIQTPLDLEFLCSQKNIKLSLDILEVVHKLRLQDEVGNWSKNVHFLSMFIL